MGEVINHSIPWLGRGKNKTEVKLTKTTSGGSQETKWVQIGTNLNPGEAVVIKGRLESEEIPVVVQQEAIGSFIGLTVGSLGSANVLVPEPLADRALAILAETYDTNEEDTTWTDDDV